MVYDFIQNKKCFSVVDILVPSMGRDIFYPKVIPGGKKLSIGMGCPDFFFKYDSLEMVNKYNKNYNHNS